MREMEDVKRHLDGETEDLQNQVWYRYSVAVQCTPSETSLCQLVIAQDLQGTTFSDVFHPAKNQLSPARVFSLTGTQLHRDGDLFDLFELPRYPRGDCVKSRVCGDERKEFRANVNLVGGTRFPAAFVCVRIQLCGFVTGLNVLSPPWRRNAWTIALRWRV